MSLDGILAAIRADGDAEIDEIRQEGGKLRDDLLRKARAQSAAAERAATSARDGAALRRHDRIVNRARLMADRELRAAGEAIYQEAAAEAHRRIADLRGTPPYGALLTRLLDECLAVLPEARIVEIDSRDAEVAARILEEQRLHHVSIESTLHAVTGIAVSAADGRRIDNTIEARARRAERFLRQIAAESIPCLRERTR